MALKFKGRIEDDPEIRNLLNAMPDDVKKSFTEKQLTYLKTAVASRQWGSHPVDLRGTVKGFKHRYYYVFLAGKNKRELSRREEKMSQLIQAGILSLFLTLSVLIGLVVLYVLKSALGINLFEGFSLGLWDWINT